MYLQDCAALAGVYAVFFFTNMQGFFCQILFSVSQKSFPLRPQCRLFPCMHQHHKKKSNYSSIAHSPLLFLTKTVMNFESSGSTDNHTNPVSFFPPLPLEILKTLLVLCHLCNKRKHLSCLRFPQSSAAGRQKGL